MVEVQHVHVVVYSPVSILLKYKTHTKINYKGNASGGYCVCLLIRYYTSDILLSNAFLHGIGVDDDVWPESWKNLKAVKVDG